MNIPEELHTAMSRTFTVMLKRPKMCRTSSNSSSHFLFPRDFSVTFRTTEDSRHANMQICY